MPGKLPYNVTLPLGFTVFDANRHDTWGSPVSVSKSGLGLVRAVRGGLD